MDKEIRIKRNELREGSQRLKELSFDNDLNYENSKRIQNKQDKIYKKFKFYDGFIKAADKVKEEK